MPGDPTGAGLAEWHADLVALDPDRRRRALAYIQALRAEMAAGVDAPGLMPVVDVKLCSRRGPCVCVR